MPKRAVIDTRYIVFIGIAILLAGMFGLYDAGIDATWTRTTGTKYTADTQSDNPLYVYTIPDGREFVVKSKGWGNTFKPESQTVFYNPRKPDQAEVMRTNAQLFGLWALTVSGLGISIYGNYRTKRRPIKPKKPASKKS